MAKILFLLLLQACIISGCADKADFTNDPNYSASSVSQFDGFDEDGFETAQPQIIDINDPLEGWNRFWFVVNDELYDYVLTPVNSVYTTVMPNDFQNGISNFFSNLGFPVRFLNNILQGEFHGAGVEMGAFIINTTVGLGGFFDIAERNHPEVRDRNRATFGQTLAVWGFGQGSYLVLPVLGPSTVRDMFGTAGDFAMDPRLYIYMDSSTPFLAATIIEQVNYLDDMLSTYKQLRDGSLEPYLAIRDAYLKNSQAKNDNALNK